MLADDLSNGPKAIIAATAEGTRRCEAFILAVGGTLEHLTRAPSLDALAKLVDLGELYAIVTDDPDPLAGRDLPIVAIFDPALLSPDEELVNRYSLGDPVAWAPLVDRLLRGHLGVEAPPAFIDALCGVGREEWVTALRGAIEQGLDVPEHATALLRDWLGPLSGGEDYDFFADNVEPLDDEEPLFERLAVLERKPPPDVVERCRALRDEYAAAHAYTEPHLRACLIYTARLLEEGAWDEAFAAAEDAIAVATEMGDGTFRDVARRLRVGARLGKLEFAPAFAELDELFVPELPSPERDLLGQIFGGPAKPGPVLHTKRFFSDLDPLDDALRAVAFHAQGAKGPNDREWREALVALAGALEQARPADAALVRRHLA